MKDAVRMLRGIKSPAEERGTFPAFGKGLLLCITCLALSACAPKFNFTPSNVAGGTVYTGGSQACGTPSNPCKVFRSVGPGNTSVIACGGSDGSGCANNVGALTLSGSSASFASGLPTNIGVGDVIVYDANADGSLGAGDSLVFISGRSSSTNYSVQNVSGGAPSGTYTGSVWRIYRAYTSIQNAMTGSTSENSSIIAIDTTLGDFDAGFNGNNNLVSNNEQWNIAVYADAVDTYNGVNLDISGWTTSASNNLKIYAPYLSTEVGASQRHNGVWESSGAATIDFPAAWNIMVNQSYTTLDGFQVSAVEANGGDDVISAYGANTTNITISNNILDVTDAPTNNFGGIGFGNGGGSVTNVFIVNNIVYGAPTGIGWSESGASAFVYNNTVVKSGKYGIDNSWGGEVSLKNNLVVESGTADYSDSNAADYVAADNNLSGDATSPNATLRGRTVAFANEPISDYLLSANDTSAINAGADLSSDPNFPLSADIAGISRPQSTGWDIGAGEAVPASGNATQMLSLTLQGANASFVATALFSGDNNGNNWAAVYYCDTTLDGANCDPFTAGGWAMARSSGKYTLTVTGVTNGDTYKVVLVATDADGVSGSGITENVTIGAQQIYVSDNVNNRIEVFGLSGSYLSQYGGTVFSQPIGPTFDASGNMWTADTNNNRIVEYNPSETYVTAFGSAGSGNGQCSNPQVVAINAGGDFYVVDQLNFRVETFDSSGNYLFQFGSKGTGNGQFESSWGIAIGPTGNVYVADQTNDNIQIFSPNGTYLSQFGSTGTGNGQFSNLQSITIDSAGDLYAADTSNCRVEKFDASGNYLSQFGSCGAGNGQFNSLSSVAVDSAGNIYAADQNNNAIQIFDSTGAFQSKFGSAGTGNGQFNSPQYVVVH